jgi:hypothetical protein
MPATASLNYGKFVNVALIIGMATVTETLNGLGNFQVVNNIFFVDDHPLLIYGSYAVLNVHTRIYSNMFSHSSTAT